MATTESLTMGQEFYVAYYGRPADPSGLTYWADRFDASDDLTEVLAAFGESVEFTANFGSLTDSELVNNLYLQMFNRDAESEGLTFYTDLLTSGAATLASIAKQIVDGAQGNDVTVLANKATVAQTYTDLVTSLGATYESDDIADAQAILDAVDETAASVTEGNAEAEAEVASNVEGETFTLTNGTDVETAQVFTSNLVYTPGGDDRINALQDEDILTGQGSNPTLNATIGNANDNGATVITPKLNGIETLNAAFTGSGPLAVTDLDLQDATGMKMANITRVSQAVNTAELGNIVNALESMSVSSSNSNQAGVIEFSYTAGALAGANSSALELTNVDLLALNIGQNTSGVGAAMGVATQGYETLAVASTGANAIGTFNLPMDTDTDGTVTITGTGTLTLGRVANIVNAGNAALTEAVGVHTAGTGIAQAGGRIAAIDASEYEGDLTLVLDNILDIGKAGTSGVVQNVTVTLGAGDDTIALYDAVQAGDTLIGGDGADNLVFYTGSSLASSAAEFEASTMLADGSLGGTISLDYDFLPDATGMTVRNISAAAGVNVAEAPVTFTLYDMTATQALGLSIQHATTLNNQIVNTVIRAAVKANTASDTVGVSIDEGINTDVRGNFTVDTTYAAVGAVPGSGTSTFENVTLTDNDSESNSVELNDFGTHTGTITINGPGVTGTFLNLDVDTAGADVTAHTTGADGLAVNVNQGMFGIDTSGNGVDLAKADWSTGNVVDVGALATQVRLGAATIDASGEASDVIVRVSTNAASLTGAQTITTGAGNDVVIFDMLNESHAGLTISDTVNAGEGNDTLVIDGDGVIVSLAASEWTNVSNFETIRLVGNTAAATGTTLGLNSYNLTLTNDLINSNGTDLLAIVNDNDQNNDAVVTTLAAAIDTVTIEANAESAVTIDAQDLNASNHFSYNGEEGASRTTDRFIFRDANVNGGNIIDGGAVIQSSSLLATNTGSTANADIFEVRNNGIVTIGDLAGISNIGTIVLNNDTGAQTTLNLDIDDATIDRLVNSYHASTIDTIGNIERLTIDANDGTVIGATGGARVVLDATGVTGRTAFTFTDDTVNFVSDIVTVAASVTGGSHSITFSGNAADTDTIAVTGAPTTVTYVAGAYADTDVSGTVNLNDAGTITYTTGAATKTDTVANADVLDISGLSATSVVSSTGTVSMAGAEASLATVVVTLGAADTLTITDSNYTPAADANLVVTAGGTVAAGTAGLTINLSNQSEVINFTGSTGADTFVAAAGGGTITGGTGNDTINLGVVGVAVDNVIYSDATDGTDTYTNFDFGGGALNDNLQLTIAALADIGAGGADVNVSTAINAGGFAVTALAVDTAAVGATDFVALAAGLDNTAVALNAGAAAIQTAIIAQLADGTDFSANIIAINEGTILLSANSTVGGAVDSYFLSRVDSIDGNATTDAGEVTLLGIFSDADGATAAAGDFI